MFNVQICAQHPQKPLVRSKNDENRTRNAQVIHILLWQYWIQFGLGLGLGYPGNCLLGLVDSGNDFSG